MRVACQQSCREWHGQVGANVKLILIVIVMIFFSFTSTINVELGHFG